MINKRTQADNMASCDDAARKYCEEDVKITKMMFDLSQEKSNKFLDVILKDQNNLKTRIISGEFPNILIEDHKITAEELNNALDIIASYLMQNNAERIISDLNKRNILAGPAEEMTLGDIEEALGHKVKIINQ